MGKPRRLQGQEDVTDMREVINAMNEKLNDLIRSKEDVTRILILVEKLEKDNAEKDKKIQDLEQRIDDMEQYSKMDNIIISGLETKHISYSRDVSASSSKEVRTCSPDNKTESLENSVLSFINDNLDLNVSPNDVSICHTLKGKKNKPDIVVRFSNRKSKIEILRNAKKLKGTEVYINEHLTRKKCELAKRARDLKKEDKIGATWVRGCRVFVKTIGSNGGSMIHIISDMKDFEKYKIT